MSNEIKNKYSNISFSYLYLMTKLIILIHSSIITLFSSLSLEENYF